MPYPVNLSHCNFAYGEMQYVKHLNQELKILKLAGEKEFIGCKFIVEPIPLVREGSWWIPCLRNAARENLGTVTMSYFQHWKRKIDQH